MQVQPYLFFEGRCDEAVAFYTAAIGAKAEMLMRYKDAPDQSMLKPENAEKVMHLALRIGETTIFASDGHCSGQMAPSGFALSVSAANEAEAHRLFNGLADGGQIGMPIAQTFFSPAFGMVTDRFGILWMVMATA